jgi:SAM-dependent methyltransferase
MLPPEIMAYYRRGGERDRLAAGAGRLEFLRTWDLLTRLLPGPPATVLDVGGATGAYARPLAAAGYRVHLIDPVPEHVAEVATLPGVTASIGAAGALPVTGGVADAVLLLGPLYHLLDRAERVRAWQEAARTVRAGGPVLAATISRYASLFDGFVKGYVTDARFRPLVERALTSGTHRNAAGEPGWFTSAYFHHPDELAGEVTGAGLRVERVVAIEGPLWMMGAGLDAVLDDPIQAGHLLDLMRRVEDHPSLLGASAHLLTAARRH